MRIESDRAQPPSPFERVFVPVHREGWPFVGLCVAAAIGLGLLWPPLFWLGLLAAGACAFFFRDPPRVTPLAPGLVVSPADGIIQSISLRVPPPELGLGSEPLPCVSVFMSVFDVHVNRTPLAGHVRRRTYQPGKFLNASLDKASDDNERQGFVMVDERNREVAVVQIAGLVARRIVAFVAEGERLAAGDRIGLIRFGSRCDVYLPRGVVPQVCVGQRAIAGETILARLDGPQVPVEGRRT